MRLPIIHINSVEYDAARVVEEMISDNEEWRVRGFEFLIQMLDGSEGPVKFKTSGTTGAAKEILFSKSQIKKSAANSCRFFNLDEHSTLFLCLPTEFVAGRMMIARTLSVNAKLIWKEPSLNPDLGTDEIHFAAFTPAQVATLISSETSRNAFARIKTVIIGGGEISESLEEELKKFSNSIFATYGMTETLTHVAVRKIGQNIYRSIYPELVFSVNENECLKISLPFISNENLTTKDVVDLNDEHSFIWKGRLDNVINTGGIKIYSEELEHKIVRFGLLKENSFYITSLRDAVFGQVPVIAMLNAPHNMDVAAFLTKLNEVLNKHEHVKHVYFFDKFELTPTGKLKRKKF